MTQIPSTDGETHFKGSPERFGFEWKHYAEMRPEYEEHFRRWVTPLPEPFWRGKSFLDVGCGMGRNSYWPLMWGAAEGVSVDVDENSLASARRNLGIFPNSRVENMSAYEIAYRDRFDIAFCIGVLHHLADPRLALANLAKAAKPGGKVLVWVYGYENNEWLVRVLDPVRKALFCWLPIRLVHALSLLPTALLWLLLRLGMNHLEYLKLLRSYRFRHLRSIVFDQMLPKIAHYWRRDEVEDLMKAAGLEDVQLTWVNELSWTAVGTKPAA
jgi:SAM-dependent methyltransferase